MNKTDTPALDENNNYIDSTTGKMMHVLTVDEMPTKQELMLGTQNEPHQERLLRTESAILPRFLKLSTATEQ